MYYARRGEETRRDEIEKQKGKRKKERRDGKRTNENFSIREEGDRERVIVILMMKKRLKKWTYRTRKDDVEPTSWTPTYLRYLMIVKENLGNSVCKGWITSLPTSYLP